MKYKNILITGGNGKLGRIVCEHLEKQGYTVTLFDQFGPADAVPPWDGDCKALILKGNLNNLGDCMSAISHSNAEVIIHLAALPHDTDINPNSRNQVWRRVQRNPEDTTMKANVMGTYYLLDAARKMGVKKMVFASTFFTLGCGFRISKKQFQVDYLPLDEEHESRPEDTYSLSKVLNEEMMKAYARAYDMKFVALRLLGVTFPFREAMPLATLEDVKKNAEASKKSGNSDFNTYMYIDARDIANVCELAIEKDLDNDFEAFFLATGTGVKGTPAEIIEIIRPDLKEMAKNIPDGEGIITCKKIKDMLGYKPQYVRE